MDRYDLAIIGGGLVGGSLACALGGAGLRVCLVEAVPPASQAQPSYDERVIALITHGIGGDAFAIGRVISGRRNDACIIMAGVTE